MSELAPLLRRVADILEEVGDRGCVFIESLDGDGWHLRWWKRRDYGDDVEAWIVLNPARTDGGLVFNTWEPGKKAGMSCYPYVPTTFLEFLDAHFPKEEGK